MSSPTLLSLVWEGQMAEFESCDGTYLRYRVGEFEFPIPLEETRGGYFGRTVKAITLMRWIRKHLENLQKARSQTLA